MSNLTHILIYLRAFAPTTTTYIPPQDRLAGGPKDPAFKYMILFLVSISAMVIFTVSGFWELRQRHQGQQNRLSAFELDMMDVDDRILPGPDLPELDDDGFMLPPPAYELRPALESNMLDINGRLLVEPELPDLDEDDDFVLPSPAYELRPALESNMLDINGRLLLEPGLPDFDEDDDFMLPSPAYELLPALESNMLDVDDGLLPEPGLPDFDEDDDFMLPPPAYQVHENMLKN